MTLFSISPAYVLLAGAIIFLSAILRGFTGFGFALAAVPLLTLILPPRDVVIVSLLLQFVTGGIEFQHASKLVDGNSLKGLMAGALVATPVGYLALVAMTPDAARLVIAGCSITALLVTSAKWCEKYIKFIPAFAIGTASGVMNGMAAMPGPPVVAYYLAHHVPRNTARASMIIFFLMTATIGICSALVVGGISRSQVILAAAMTPLLILGNRLGKMIFDRASQEIYRRVAFLILLISAAAASWKGIGAF